MFMVLKWLLQLLLAGYCYVSIARLTCWYGQKIRGWRDGEQIAYAAIDSEGKQVLIDAASKVREIKK